MTPDLIWPAGLPLPSVETGGTPLHPTIASPIDQARISRRARHLSGVVKVDVVWLFTTAQYDIFRDFYVEWLGNGTAVFALSLRYPKQSELTEWRVQFAAQLEAVPLEALWAVSSSLFLHREIPVEIPPPVVPIGFSPFQVAPEESDGDHLPFTVAGGHPFYVKEEE